jgi:hypothetical protein
VRKVVKDRLVRNGWTIGLNMTFLKREWTAWMDDDAVIIPRTALVIAIPYIRHGASEQTTAQDQRHGTSR